MNMMIKPADDRIALVERQFENDSGKRGAAFVPSITVICMVCSAMRPVFTGGELDARRVIAASLIGLLLGAAGFVCSNILCRRYFRQRIGMLRTTGAELSGDSLRVTAFTPMYCSRPVTRHNCARRLLKAEELTFTPSELLGAETGALRVGEEDYGICCIVSTAVGPGFALICLTPEDARTLSDTVTRLAKRGAAKRD